MTSLVWCQVLAGNLNPASYAQVAQLADAVDSKSIFYGFESHLEYHMCVCWNWQTGQLEVLVFRRAGSSPAMHTNWPLRPRSCVSWVFVQATTLNKQPPVVSGRFHHYINKAVRIWLRSSEEQNASLSRWRPWVRVPSESPEWFPVPHLLLGNNTSDHNPGECPKRKKKTVGFIPNSSTPISERTRDRVANGIGVKSVWPEQSGA